MFGYLGTCRGRVIHDILAFEARLWVLILLRRHKSVWLASHIHMPKLFGFPKTIFHQIFGDKLLNSGEPHRPNIPLNFLSLSYPTNMTFTLWFSIWRFTTRDCTSNHCLYPFPGRCLRHHNHHHCRLGRRQALPICNGYAHRHHSEQ